MGRPYEAGRRTGGRRRRDRGTFLTVLSLLAAALLLVGSPPAVAVPGGAYTFIGQGVGPIPDGGSSCPTTGPPLDVTFQVTGMPPVSVDDVRVSGLVVNHPWMSDLVVVLLAPNGSSHILFGLTGISASSPMGASADLAGPYTFADDATQNWWATAAAFSTSEEPVPAGAYRTSALGGPGPGGNAPTTITPAFAGLTDPNGIWTLRFSDGCSGDLGIVSAATLELHSTGAPNCALEQAAVAAARARVASTGAARIAAASAAANADQAVQPATSRLAKAQKAFDKAKKKLEKAKRTGKPAQIKRAKATLKKARRALKTARAELETAQHNAATAHQALTSAEAAAAAAQAQLAAAQAALASC